MDKYNDDIFDYKGDTATHPPKRDGGPIDALIKNDIRDQPKILGGIPDEYIVQSVYSARPINGQDAMVSSSFITVADMGNNVNLTITVPNQTVFVIEKIYLSGLNIQLNGLDTWFVSAAINDAPLPGFLNVRIGRLFNTYLPTYFIAGPNSTVSLIVSNTTALAPDELGISLYANFCGTFLLYQGRAVNYEIATARVKL